MVANKIKIVFLGTNGWYDTATGNTICVLIETPKEYVVLDAGNGIYKLDQYVKDDKKPIYVFISHFHLDHIEGLHILAKFRFKQGITICVQKGGKRILGQIIRQPFTLAIKDLKTKVRIKEIKGVKGIQFLDKVLPLQHVSPCIGFRFNFEGTIISYVPDTEVCENALKLARDADLLIAECAFKSGQKSKEWPHLNPETAAEIAKSAKVKKLALAHFDAAIYNNLKERRKAERRAKIIFLDTIAVKDGQEVRVK